MLRSTPLVALLLALPSVAQSNAVPGTDIAIYEIGSATVAGRRGPAWPNGEAGVVIGHSMCNAGTVALPWIGWVSGSTSQMLDTYPKIAFLLARESDGRMVQVSGKSFLKHSRIAFNFSGSNPCGTCQTGPSATFRVGCYDVYSTGFNGNRTNLGPTTEIDPWLGSWNPVGSYFDRGDPSVVGPQATDGIQSLVTSSFDAVKNRMEVRERELVAPGTFWAQNHLMIKGEPVTARGNNLVSRRITFNWNGSSWSTALQGAAVQTSVLEQWTGATTSLGGNGLDDGRFLVAVKVTGPVNGMWHYEYAVHNIDNHRGGASLRIPVCADARVENLGFRDIDTDDLNQWTISRSGGELAFLATADNAIDWNTLYNFWFDSDAAPVAGDVAIDQARIGAGALAVTVATTVPGQLGAPFLGAGCGSPAPSLAINSVPNVPNPAFGLDVQLSPNGVGLLAIGASPAAVTVAPGCTLWVDDTALFGLFPLAADATGAVAFPIPLPPGLAPQSAAAQAFELVPDGPVFGVVTASNGLLLRAGGVGCR